MKYLLISFKSRNSIMKFSKTLSNRGIPNNTINTPKTIGSTCTLSIKADFQYYNQILSLLKLLKIEGFLGLFMIEKTGLVEQTQRLY
ncbi:MAG: putative Se/S carrier-like protein [Clostridia bacterium]